MGWAGPNVSPVSRRGASTVQNGLAWDTGPTVLDSRMRNRFNMAVGSSLQIGHNFRGNAFACWASSQVIVLAGGSERSSAQITDGEVLAQQVC